MKGNKYMSENKSCCESSKNTSSCCNDTEKSSNSSCCCSEIDVESAYSIEDDPYKGHKRTAIVDFLYLDLSVCTRCQGADERVVKAVEICKPILSACGYNLVLNMIEIEDEQLCERYNFLSSPTIRVNGVDVCESVEENNCDCCKEISDFDVKCRLYPFNDTYYEVPPTDMIVAAIINTVIKGEKPTPVKGYEIPENLAGFFIGKRKKESTKSSSCC